MNAKHRKTLSAILTSPAPKALPFRDIESLLTALECTVVEAEGSRVVFVHKLRSWATHRPHPGKECRGHQIRGVRQFLEEIGATE